MARHYMDYFNLDYLKLTRAQRLRKLNSYAKLISEFQYDPENSEILVAASSTAKGHKIPEDEIRFVDMEYRENLCSF
ncbi:MAG: hypothetical protein HQ557_15725 [Bacteroidetes bacterium]|nr:hypothetical protein [Bacteroidota bacterium]